MAMSELQIVLERAEKLSAREKAEIIKRLADSLTLQNEPAKDAQFLEYGKYRDYPGKLADEEDFKMAEWHPTDEELEG